MNLKRTLSPHRSRTWPRTSGKQRRAQEPRASSALVRVEAASELCRGDGDFRAYRRKGKWGAAAKAVGLAKADGDRLNDQAESHYNACADAWRAMREVAATAVLSRLVTEVRPLIDRFQAEKRRTARLDFDDLIFAARDLLRDHEAVRQALGRRYAHLLVDEFQDTDPLQAEIFWRLCGDPVTEEGAADWQSFRIRRGALFLVGDPKQAIYRFRGADVHAYLRAREAMRSHDPTSIISVSTNFRSGRSILTYVNERFANSLSAAGQPGFTPLDPFHEDYGGGPAVVALDVALPAGGTNNADVFRDCEADAVAEFCRSLIARHTVIDRKTGKPRPCRAGDIALLAPTGNDLWRYEKALEERDISVSTQAGKGFFRRQEIQDLIALTRVLADRRDRLALGALLRGPLVGLTEEELLDIAWSLPRSEKEPDRLPRLERSIDPEFVAHPLARDVLVSLQSLAKRANSTTPYDLLCLAVDALRVRPLLMQRYRRRAERALANVDLYLDLARPYSVRGLRAFAEAMTKSWEEEARTVEGRPDAEEEAAALYTMHAAKGLEWPIVIPINTATRVYGLDRIVLDRPTNSLYGPIFGAPPQGYEQARTAEAAELTRERVRLWYVATTRAGQMLILPRFAAAPPGETWLSIVDLAASTLPTLDSSKFPEPAPSDVSVAANDQTRETLPPRPLPSPSKSIRIEWVAPSRGEGAAQPLSVSEEPAVLATATDTDISPR